MANHPGDPMFDLFKRSLEQAVADGAYLNGGICLIDADGWEHAHVTGLTHPPLGNAVPVPLSDPGLRMRMASISKSVTARAACELIVAGVLDLDGDVATLLGWRYAPALTAGVTVRMLLNHTSGMTDHAGYIFERPQSATEFISEHADGIASGHAPGAWFKYSNLNYVLLGALLEAVSHQRLDFLVRELVLAPAGINGGFNWSGVSSLRRKPRLPVYQRFGTRLEQQTEPEEADWETDIVWGDGRGFSHDRYVPVRDTLLLSPHAGLRMNVIEAARLARLLGDDSPAGRLQRETSWKYDPHSANGTDCDGLYGEFGLGVMAYRGDPRLPGPLVGHAGHALGFTGGVWYNEEKGTSVGYFLTGSADLTDGFDDEVFYAPPELDLLRLI